MEPVTQLHINDVKTDIYNLETFFSGPTHVTGNHHFYCVSDISPDVPVWMSCGKHGGSKCNVRFNGPLKLVSGRIPRCAYGIRILVERCLQRFRR